MKTGKYENDWYVIGGWKTNIGDRYHITYLDNGVMACGFNTADSARIAADRAIESQLIREKRFSELRP